MMKNSSSDNSRKHLWWCNLHHIVNDGYVASLSLLLPFIAVDLGLDYTASGLLKTIHYGAICVAQLPAGFLAERLGAILLLGSGTAIFGLGYAALLVAFSFPIALLAVFGAGIGGGVYHPVGTGLIADTFTGEKSGKAIGTLNFFGDIGKVVFPAATGIMIGFVGWRGSCGLLGCAGVAVGIIYLISFGKDIKIQKLRGRKQEDKPEIPPQGGLGLGHRLQKWGIAHPGQFGLYALIGSLDTGIRSAVMAFLGFLLLREGITETNVGWGISLTFLGGAMGKLICGMPMQKLGAARLIILTETLMILGCLALPHIGNNQALFIFLPLFGFVLNGTSSVLYIGLVPIFTPTRRSRGYAMYYTLNFIASACAPIIFGLTGDKWGLDIAFYTAGGAMLLILPLTAFLRKI